jgi:hypothetical protein
MSDFIPEFGQKGDSLILWLGDTLVANIDTINMALKYTALDTLGYPASVFDTLQFVYREKKSTKKNDKPKNNERKALKVSTIANNGKQHILRDIVFTTETPISAINPSLFELFIIPDSIEIPVDVLPFQDESNLRRARISNKWGEEENYRMVLYPGAIRDIYESINDTIVKKFSIRPLSDYGKINLTLNNVNERIMIEIYKRDVVIRKEIITESGLYVFDFLDPDTYRIKFIYDRNENGKWDTGKYIDGLQAEKVEFLTKDVKVRANWDHDITYILGTNKLPPSGAEDKEEESSK